METITDFITGKQIPNVGAEMNRQAAERLLVDQKGYRPENVLVGLPIRFDIDGESYCSAIDLAVRIDNITGMLLRCVAGSLDSYGREILAACRLVEAYTVPCAVVCDGKNALVRNAITGAKMGEGLAAVPTCSELSIMISQTQFEPVDANRREREKLLYRTYNSMGINVIREDSPAPRM